MSSSPIQDSDHPPRSGRWCVFVTSDGVRGCTGSFRWKWRALMEVHSKRRYWPGEKQVDLVFVPKVNLLREPAEIDVDRHPDGTPYTDEDYPRALGAGDLGAAFRAGWNASELSSVEANDEYVGQEFARWLTTNYRPQAQLVVDFVLKLEAENERLRRELDEAQLRSIEARNPGIDMDEVRRLRASGDSVTRPERVRTAEFEKNLRKVTPAREGDGC